jgi:Protein phosphatase 2C
MTGRRPLQERTQRQDGSLSPVLRRALSVTDPYWPDWRAVSTSVIGSGHLDIYRECQDAFRCNLATLTDPRTLSNGRPAGPFIASIADGLGSAPNSALGAALAVAIAQTAAEDAFSAFPWDTAAPWDFTKTLSAVLESALGQLRASVGAIIGATGRGWHESSFSATLLVVVFRPPWLVTANVGDGFVIAQRSDGQLLMVAHPYVSVSDGSATVPALHLTALARASVTTLYDPGLKGFAASTDGLKEISLDWEGARPVTPHHDFFAPLLAGIANGTLTSAQVTRFLHQERIGGQAGDDLTLVAMARAVDEGRN